MHVSQMFPGRFVSAADLKGRDVRVTIGKLERTRVGPTGKQKWVLLFVGKEKGLILNKTNATLLAELLGPETNDWLGKQIVIGPRTTTFADKQVPCIRVIST